MYKLPKIAQQASHAIQQNIDTRRTYVELTPEEKSEAVKAAYGFKHGKGKSRKKYKKRK